MCNRSCTAGVVAISPPASPTDYRGTSVRRNKMICFSNLIRRTSFLQSSRAHSCRRRDRFCNRYEPSIYRRGNVGLSFHFLTVCWPIGLYGWLANWLPGKLAAWQNGFRTGWLLLAVYASPLPPGWNKGVVPFFERPNWLTGKLASWQIGWLATCMSSKLAIKLTG